MSTLRIAAALAALPCAAAAAEKPNVIFILADDLGYGDLGCYGQKRIKTPNLDRMAREGLRFTQVYAGSTVCAPSRCCLMTGLHTGHARIRGNARYPLLPEDVTAAEIFKRAGYKTGLVGKWGLGEAGSTGIPTRQGFDYFFGYLNQHHAHNSYPDFLWRNAERVPLPGNKIGNKEGVSVKTETFSQDLFMDEALKFVTAHKADPFFLYWAVTIPHANNERGRAEGNGMEVPSDEPYSSKPWPQAQKNHAAMITRLDADVGKLMAKLRELGVADNTLVIFTSDNGPHREGGAKPDFFDSNGPVRGIKRDLTEGGIRVPAIAHWPGRVKPGVSGHVWAFWDFPVTAADLVGVAGPPKSDGVSFLPTLLGRGTQKEHKGLYWEFHERGYKQAARVGDWKAIKVNARPAELYNLAKDIGEANNLAKRHPEIVKRMEAYMKQSRTDSPQWPVRIRKARRRKK